MTLIAPSILSADFARLASEVAVVEAAGADWLHVDVMDGHFVPNLTIGPPVAAALKPVTHLPLDCHLMITNPDQFVPDFAKAGADWLCVHAEVCPHLHRSIAHIKEHGMKPGVALNPSTPLNVLEYVLDDLAYVLIMSVNPGFGGQKFIGSAVEKIARLKGMIRERGLEVLIQVDGGINAQTIRACHQAGADCFVAGSAIFGHPQGPAQAISLLRDACQ